MIKVICKRGYIYGPHVNVFGGNSSSGFKNSLSGAHHKCWGKSIETSEDRSSNRNIKSIFDGWLGFSMWSTGG